MSAALKELAEDLAKPENRDLGRVDRKTFNYGRALGAPPYEPGPWSTRGPGRDYATVEKACRALGEIANKFSAASWELEMALRDVRQCETREEQTEALATMAAKYRRIDRELDRVEGNGVKFYRYGRTGEVLRSVPVNIPLDRHKPIVER